MKINGIDINLIDDMALINNFSYIDQNVFVFKGSVFNNITLYNNNYSKEKVIQLMKILGLYNFIAEIDNENFIKENGRNLSPGEKQRLLIARVLIRDCKLILADEMFSSLDNQNALNIESYLLNQKDLTLISVTHKLIAKSLRNMMRY